MKYVHNLDRLDVNVIVLGGRFEETNVAHEIRV